MNETQTAKIKVIIVDDLKFSRDFFEMAVTIDPHYELVRTFDAAEDAVEFCVVHEVDMLIMDVLMREGLDGLSAAEQIKKANPAIKIILVTASAESSWLPRARAAGVNSFWYKEYSDVKLAEVMERTARGESVYPTNPPDLPFGDTNKSALSERELDVLRELTAGYTNQEIADHLGISVNTVRTHITNMINKTGYESRFDLALNAKALGVVVGESKKGE